MGELINLNEFRADTDQNTARPVQADMHDVVDPVGIDSIRRRPTEIANRAMPGLMDAVDELSELEQTHERLLEFLSGGEAQEDDYFIDMNLAEAKTELVKIAAELEAARAERSRLFELTYDQINRAADGQDPVGYLTASLNVQYPGYSVGDNVGSSLGYLLRAGERDEIPVLVSGSDLHGLTVGSYAGLPIVKRPGVGEYRFDNSSRLALYLQLANVSGFAKPEESNSAYQPWGYEGNGTREVGARQLMRWLVVTDRSHEILEATLFGGRGSDTRINEIDASLKRHLREQTGLAGQAIVYGHSAVKGILGFLHGEAAPETDLAHLSRPSRDEILAAGLSIGISPSELSTGVIGFRRRLAAHFIGTLTHSVVSYLRNENSRLSGGKSNSTVNWSILASPQVYRYLGMGKHDLATAAINGLAISERLSARGSYNRSHGLGSERLTKIGAAQVAARLIAMRYAIDLEPTEFSTDLSRLPDVDASLADMTAPVAYIADATRNREQRS